MKNPLTTIHTWLKTPIQATRIDLFYVYLSGMFGVFFLAPVVGDIVSRLVR